MSMSESTPRRNGYCESGFAGKSVHADATDCWRAAIDNASLRDLVLANVDAAGKEKHQRGACSELSDIVSDLIACRPG